jgi:hypothetical protein
MPVDINFTLVPITRVIDAPVRTLEVLDFLTCQHAYSPLAASPMSGQRPRVYHTPANVVKFVARLATGCEYGFMCFALIGAIQQRTRP